MTTTTFRIGDLTIHRIVEQETGTRPAFDFLAGLTPDVLEQNRAWLEPDALVPGTTDLSFCFQSYVVETPHHTVLVDSCIGNHKVRPKRPAWHLKDDDYFMDALGTAGIAVTDIDYVMCTHLHADHVGWNTRLDNGRWVPTFPNARYLMSGTEYAYWAEQHAKAPIDCIADSVLPVIEQGRAELVGSAHALNDHIRLLPTPGHTIDHFAVGLGRGSDAVVMTGDLIHSPLQARYPELCARVDFDHPQAAATRRAFLERQTEAHTVCCTAHFPSPSYGRFQRWGDGFQFVVDRG